MSMRLFKIFVILLNTTICFNPISAETIKVKKICLSERDLSARTSPRTDLNGNKCALLKVYLPLSGARFLGNLIGQPEYLGGEYWVYMTEGTKKLQLMIPNELPMNISFIDAGVGQLVSGSVYEIFLSSSPDSKSLYNFDDYQKDITTRESLIKHFKFNDALTSLQTLKDSVSSIADERTIKSINTRIDYCKRQINLSKTDCQEVGVLTEGRIGIKKDGKYGLADSIGNVIVYPQFDNAINFNNGVAWARKGGLWGNIDRDGVVRVPFTYDGIGIIDDGINPRRWIQASNGKSVGIINYVNGTVVYPFKYSWSNKASQRFFVDTFGGFEVGGSICMAEEGNSPDFALWDNDKKRVVLFSKESCEQITTLDKGVFFSTSMPFNLIKTYGEKKKNDRYETSGLIDDMGRIVLECRYDIQPIRGTKEYVFVKPADSPIWSSANGKVFSLKLREYISNTEVSAIDKLWKDWAISNIWWSEYKKPYISFININTGKNADIDASSIGKYYELTDCNDKLLLRSYVGQHWYIFNNDGSYVTLPASEYSYYIQDRPVFQFGVQPFLKNGKWGFVNMEGIICIEPIYDEVSFFSPNGDTLVSEVTLDGTKFRIDINGNRVSNQ